MGIKKIVAGRLNRKNLALGYLVIIGSALLIGSVSLAVPSLNFLFLFVGIAVWISASILIIKRLHDLGMSGTNLIVLYLLSVAANSSLNHHEIGMRLAGFLISAGLIYFIFLKEGQPVDNEYGKADQPKNFIDAILNR